MQTTRPTGERATLPVTRIRGGSAWGRVDLAELWRFRDLLLAMAVRDFKLRYRQTVLGVVWVVVQPLLGAGIFTFVFGLVAGMDSGGTPYFLFSFSALLAWNCFASTLQRVSGSFLGNAGLITKVYFPRLIPPASVLGGTLVDFAVAFAALLGLLWCYGVAPGAAILTVPLWVGMALTLALGVGIAVGSLAVRYRDVAHILAPVVQFWLFATPVAYPLERVPEALRGFYWLNPMTAVVEGMRWASYGHAAPSAAHVALAAAVILAALGVGIATFCSQEKGFADVI